MKKSEYLNKAINTKDILRRIVKMRIVDVLFGVDRDDLNYVDCLYPYVEDIFGIDCCIESSYQDGILKEYYNNNYEADISYEQLLDVFSKAEKLCDELPENKKDKILLVNEELKPIIDNITKTKIKTKKNVK